MKKETKFQKNPNYLPSIYGWFQVILISLTILILPFLVSTKFLTFDAQYYLQYAELFYKGDLLNAFWSGKMENYGIWPLGFPALIGVFSFFTQGDVFLAARLVQVAIFLVFVFLFRNRFGNDWVVYLSILVTGATLSLFKYTLAEAGFILFSLLMAEALLARKNPKIGLAILLLPIMVFSMRYIGVYLIVFFISYWLLLSERKILIYSTLLLGVFVLLYFLKVYGETGLYSGIERKGGTLSRVELLIQFVLSLLAVFSYFDVENIGGKWGKILFFLGLIPYIVLLIQWLKSKIKLDHISQWNQRAKVYGLMGFSYLLVYFVLIIGLGWDHDGGGIEGRYVVPGMVFIVLSLFIQFRSKQPFSKWSQIILYSSSMIAISYYLISGLLVY